MVARSLQMFAVAAMGFGVAVLSSSLWTPKPAGAQVNGRLPSLQAGVPVGGLQVVGGNTVSQAPSPPPLVIEALDAERFVVATREPRLVQEIGREGTAQNMIVTVVTHYTVRGDRMFPVEHVRVPTGYRAVQPNFSE